MGRSKNEEDHGLLISWLEAATGLMVRFSLGKKLEGDHPNRLDLYVLSWVAFEVALIVALVFLDLPGSAETALIVLFSYHLVEIAVTSFYTVIIMPIEHKKHRSVPRLFSLVFFDYVEVILIFGIIFDFILENGSILKSLQYSVSQATLAGATFDQESNALFAASIVELLLGVFFVTGVIATISNYLGTKE